MVLVHALMALYLHSPGFGSGGEVLTTSHVTDVLRPEDILDLVGDLIFG